MDRRTFLLSLAALTGGCAMLGQQGPETDRIGAVLPRRPLGKTGERVTMLGVGGFHIGWTTERDAQEVIEAALEGGVRFFDNAESYGPHTAEERYGKYLVPQYREDVFIMTKSNSKTKAEALGHLEASLRRMKCDYVDLWQVHTIFNPGDVDARIDGGVVDAMVEARDRGLARTIGFTGHAQPQAHARMLERVAGNDPFDVCQLPINPVDAGAEHSFTAGVLPTLVERGYGVIAMKTLADGRFFAKKVMQGRTHWETDNPVTPDRITIEEALAFAWSLPVSVLVTGAENAELMREKTAMCRACGNMGAAEREELVARVADLAAAGTLEYYKSVA